HHGGGRARLVHRAGAHGCHRRDGRRACGRAAMNGLIRLSQEEGFSMFAYPTAKTARAFLLGASIPGAASAASLGGAAPQQPAAAAIATAKELITVKGADKLWQPLVPGVIEQAKSVFLQTNPMLSKDLNEVAAKLRTEYAARSAEVLNDIAKLYAGRF